MTATTASTRLVLMALLCTLAAPVEAKRTSLAIYGPWGVFEDSRPERNCFAIATPDDTQASRSGISRGDTYISISSWPGRKIEGQFFWAAGFPIDDDKSVELKVGETRFRLLPSGSSAWAADPATDKRILAALRGGATARITSVSRRGTQLTDSFDLTGLSAAVDSARQACAK